jgi:hypothetical protein
MTRKLSFQAATSKYVHRYTAEHVPQWARTPAPNGKFYAPHFGSDREWYDNTLFHGESALASRKHCYTSGQTWPLGQWLDEPFRS